MKLETLKKKYPNRKEAEATAIKCAFEILNKRK